MPAKIPSCAPSPWPTEILGGTADDTGGSLTVFNKTGEGIVQLCADEYVNGVVSDFNRKRSDVVSMSANHKGDGVEKR